MSSIPVTVIPIAEENGAIRQVRMQLVDCAGRLSLDLGLGRLFGQLLAYLYLHETPCSLDDICADLVISKASASIGARQMERLGLVVRVWVQGDRKTYYRSADNIATAMQHGLSGFLMQKVRGLQNEIDTAGALLQPESANDENVFLLRRLSRARELCAQVTGLLGMAAAMKDVLLPSVVSAVNAGDSR